VVEASGFVGRKKVDDVFVQLEGEGAGVAAGDLGYVEAGLVEGGDVAWL